MHAHTYVCTPALLHSCMYACMPACADVCVYVFFLTILTGSRISEGLRDSLVSAIGTRCPSSTLLPLLVWGPLIKTEY